jgi:hypothetical protein
MVGEIKGIVYNQNSLSTSIHTSDQQWGYSTDQMLMMIQTLIGSDRLDIVKFNKILTQYTLTGLTGVKDGDEFMMKMNGIDDYTRHVLEYKTEPIQNDIDVTKRSFDACDTYIGSNDTGYTDVNSCLIRALIPGMFSEWDVLSYATTMSTHADHRCISSAVIITAAVNSMLNGITTDVSRIVGETSAMVIGLKKMTDQSQLNEFMRYTSEGYYTDLNLAAIGYNGSKAYKTMACAMYALKKLTDGGNEKDKQPTFTSILDEICAKGGDVGTNCALAGALIGCELGYTALQEQNEFSINELAPGYEETFNHITSKYLYKIGYAANTDPNIDTKWRLVLKSELDNGIDPVVAISDSSDEIEVRVGNTVLKTTEIDQAPATEIDQAPATEIDQAPAISESPQDKETMLHIE